MKSVESKEHTPVIVSLGYNCEVSFRIEDYLGRLDSYLYSWSYEVDNQGFIASLYNMNDVFQSEIEIQQDYMFRDEKYKIKFHPRYDILLSSSGNKDTNYEIALSELKKRIEHLKNKTIRLFSGKDKIVFLMKIDNNTVDCVNYIQNVYEALQSTVKADFSLVIVLEKNKVSDDFLQMENDRLQIRFVKKYAPKAHTDIMGDFLGWYRILREYSAVNSKVYFKNVLTRIIVKYPRKLRFKIAKNI